jgi:hypothetical protein
MNLKIAAMAATLGLSVLTDQCQSPPPHHIEVTEAAYEDFEVPDISPPTELWVKMDGQNYNPDMSWRCLNMGGYLIDDVCHDIDY